MEIQFLTVEQVLKVHDALLRKDGGGQGVKDLRLIESALGNVQQTFGGKFLYRSVGEMAGALWFGLVMNHAFVDGNKRVGLACASVFLRINGYVLNLTNAEAEQITLKIASSEMSREEVMRVVVANISKL